MALSNIGGLLEKRRSALLEYCIGQVANDKYPFLKTPEDLFELLRMDPLDTYQVKSSRVAEAISCVQQYIHAVYRKLEPGFQDHEFDKRHLREWEIFCNYPDWTVIHQVSCYAENFVVPSVRLRKTSLFKNLENNLNQARLDKDTVQAALQDYLQAFEQICDLDVSSMLHGRRDTGQSRLLLSGAAAGAAVSVFLAQGRDRAGRNQRGRQSGGLE